MVKKAQPAASHRTKALGSSTAASILGTAVKSPAATNGQTEVKAEWAKYQKHLLELRERLLNQMSGLAKESAEEMAGYSLHMADSGTDNFDRDFALSLLSLDRMAFKKFKDPLNRTKRTRMEFAN